MVAIAARGVSAGTVTAHQPMTFIGMPCSLRIFLSQLHQQLNCF
jgi:hypothetical protein